MKKIILCLAVFLMIALVSFSQLNVQKLLTENRTNSIGLDVVVPRFSWQLNSTKRNVMQTTYETQILANGKTAGQSGRKDNYTTLETGSGSYHFLVSSFDK